MEALLLEEEKFLVSATSCSLEKLHDHIKPHLKAVAGYGWVFLRLDSPVWRNPLKFSGFQRAALKESGRMDP